MWEMVRRVEELNSAGIETAPRREVAMGFAAKVIGIGVVAGLMLTYCNALIDACFRGIH
jgi:hypothetical protein